MVMEIKRFMLIIGYEQMTMNEYCKRYTKAINPPEAFWEMPQKKESRKADDLLSMGFTQAQLYQYFDKKESQIGGEVYILKDNIVIKSQEEGDIKITSVEDLAEYVGANSRKSLKDKGLTDEVIDKYFKLTLNGNSGKATYALNYKYKSYSVTKGDNFTDLYLNTMDGKSIKVHIDSDGNITNTYLPIKVHIDSDGNITTTNLADNEPKTIDPFTRKLITVSEFKTKYGDGNQKIYVAINPPEAFWEMPQKKRI